MMKALIIYASWTGNTQKIAEILKKSLESFEIETRCINCEFTEAAAFQKVDIAVVATYTFGSQGDLPAEIEGIYFDLEDLNLENQVYGVLGSGEEAYGYFCKSVDDFEKQFEKTGATKGVDSLKIEENPKEKDLMTIQQFAKKLVETTIKKGFHLKAKPFLLSI